MLIKCLLIFFSFWNCSREYLSEYKKRFRPFSQYEYVDGKFFKKKGDQEIGSPWFHEVIELRKKAGEYRVRTIILKQANLNIPASVILSYFQTR